MRGMLRSIVRAGGGGLIAAMLLVGTAHAGWVNGGFETDTSVPPAGWTHKTYSRPNVLPASPPVPDMNTGITLPQLGLTSEATGNANNRSAIITAPAVPMPLSGANLSSIKAPRWDATPFV